MTGDITIKLDAAILLVTNEILFQMHYRRSEVIREVAWVIYEEDHYMIDHYQACQ